jgi:hypothetical protein
MANVTPACKIPVKWQGTARGLSEQPMLKQYWYSHLREAFGTFSRVMRQAISSTWSVCVTLVFVQIRTCKRLVDMRHDEQKLQIGRMPVYQANDNQPHMMLS